MSGQVMHPEFKQMIPSNVAPGIVRDFDFYDFPGVREDAQLAWKAVQDAFPPVFWTPRNGGHWVVTRATDIETMQKDDTLVSYSKTSIPPNPTPSLPLEADAPEHGPLRATISPLFAPQTLRGVEKMAREYSIELIDELMPRGSCEFVSEFGHKLPIAIFLMLVELPLSDAKRLLPLVADRVKASDPEVRNRAKQAMAAYLAATINERRANPGTDFISRIVTTMVDGRPLTGPETENMLTTVMFGGLHTVATMMAFVMRHLASHPADREALRNDPAKIPAATNEMMRRYGIVATSRVIRHDVAYRGVNMRKGDAVLVPNMLAGLDECLFPDPLRVDFDRPNAGQHAAFGNGSHRCPGANLGRLEVKILIEEWLKRIPDFSIDPGSVKMSGGIVAAIEHMTIRW